jgi:hypothetical protein
VTEHLRKLEALAGRWVGEETLAPSPADPDGGVAQAEVDAHFVLDGMFLVTAYTSDREGHVSYHGLGVTGWDLAESCYTLHWFDSMGATYPTPARGHWRDGGMILEVARGPTSHTRYTYSFPMPDTYVFRIESSKDRARWDLVMQGTYKRRP